MRTIVRAYYHFFHKKFSDYATRYPTIFCGLEIITFFYSLLALSYLMNVFLMRTLYLMTLSVNNLAALKRTLKKHKVSPKVSSFISIIGSSAPEFFLNVFSCISNSSKLAIFGFSAIAGSGIFGFAAILAVVGLATNPKGGKGKKFDLQLVTKELLAYLATMIFLLFTFWTKKITLLTSLILISVFPLYVLLNSSGKEEAPNRKESNNKLKTPTIKFLEPGFYIDKYAVFHDTNTEGSKYISYSFSEDSANNSEEEEEDLILDKTGDFGMNNYQNNSAYKPLVFIVLEDIADKMYSPLRKLFLKTIPVEKAPLIALIISIFYCLLIIKYVIFVVDTVSEYSSFPIAFIGAFLYTWGRNFGDVASAAVIANKENQAEQTIANFIGSQVFNLQICLGFPWMVVNLCYGAILIYGSSLLQLVSWSLLMICVVLGLMIVFQFRLGKSFGILSILVYILYIVCIFNLY